MGSAMGRKKGRRRSPFKVKLQTDVVYSIASLILIVVGCLIIFSFSGQGTLLKKIQLTLRNQFGLAMLFVPYLFISSGIMLTKLNWKIARPNVFLGAVLIFLSLLGLFKSGSVGGEIFMNLGALIQPIGATVLLLGVGFTGFMILTESSLDELILRLSVIFKALGGLTKKVPKAVKPAAVGSFTTPNIPGIKIKGGNQSITPAESVEEKAKKKKADDIEEQLNLTSDVVQNLPGGDHPVYVAPPLDLLKDQVGGTADRGDIKHNASVIEKTLDSFGIQARVVEVNLGPAITQYALEIALGTKLSKITALQNDLALALAAPTGQIRIEAPIPGKSMVGIEIPNKTPEVVSLKQILTSDAFKKNKSKTAVGLGLNVSGEAVVADIAKMPHALIAGSTGSGKSVAINAFIAAILFRASPDEVKFIMVDPKRVELTGYNGIPHLLTPVIVEPDKVLAALEWAVNEMEQRYKLFAEVGVRNIESYNNLSGFQALPFLVIIIDELADIMLFAPSKVEDTITRLAQMARAVGIHLLLATQRPSVDVITGLIKANIPCRIAFNVASQVDSRVIIDTIGAEKLLGRGDMLYIPPEQAKASRIQGTYVSDAEIKKLIDHLKQNSGFQVEYTQEVTTKFAPKMIASPTGEAMELDTMFEEAVRIVTKDDKASASLLQRRLSIGYARAARILDQLEQAGVVGPAEGAKPRSVLTTDADAYFARQQAQEAGL